MKTWTVDEMVAERPCVDYHRKMVKKLWDGRESLSLLEVLALEIPAKDRLWVCFRPSAMDTDDIRRAWLKKITDRIVTANALHCGTPEVEKWAESWLLVDLSTESARSAARSAEWAARSAAESTWWSARSAARSAEWAARSAAESAESTWWSAKWAVESAAESARSAARSAAESAESTWWSARSAARSAEWAARSARWAEEETQIAELKAILESKL